MKRFNLFFSPEDGGGQAAVSAGNDVPGIPGTDGDDGSAGAQAPSAEGTSVENAEPTRKNVFETKFEDNQAEEATEQKAPEVPEKYEFKLQDGLVISDEQKAAFSEIAKNANMSQETVDALIKMHGDILLDAIREAEDKYNGWAEECGKQGLLTKNGLEDAKQAVSYFGGSECMDALVETGAANHPAVQRFLQNIGGLLREDVPPAGGVVKDTKATVDILFPNSKY